MDHAMELWYAQPAEEWVEALPMGNGRMGGMVFGGVQRERIALNEDTLWSGYPQDPLMENAWERIQEARHSMDQGDFFAAQRSVEQGALGNFTQAYQPLGDLWLEFPGFEGRAVSQYRRALSLRDAVAVTDFVVEGTRYRRECFVSAPDQALVLCMEAEGPGTLDADIRLRSQLRHQVSGEKAGLCMRVRCPGYSAPNYKDCPEPIVYGDTPETSGMDALVRVSVTTQGGSAMADTQGCLRVRDAKAFTLWLCCRTSFSGFDRHPQLDVSPYEALCEGDLRAAQSIGPHLRERHLADYQPLFSRVQLRLDTGDRGDLPTDERLRRFEGVQDDDGLLALLFQFGRYLLIASSRPGTQAATLQGIWNQELRPPWSSNYTLNINTQMNYWPAEICHLPETHQPLFDLIDRLTVTGGYAAKAMFHARGAFCAHNTDLWGQPTPVGEGGVGAAMYGWWPMGYGWLTAHLFEHFLYTGNLAFLKQRALPALRAAAQFFVDACKEDPRGYVSLYPATSPENAYLLEGRPMPLAFGSAMNTAILTEVFQNYLLALAALGIQEEDAAAVRAALEKLPPLAIGKDGRLLEWDQEWEEVEVEHRHLSHLYALHPGHGIIPEETPALLEACKASLRVRGDEGTGWSLGWKVNAWARLYDGNQALKIARRQLRLVEAQGALAGGGGTYRNLFDAHPPFQIDGNFGVTAGIAQMFLQVRRNTLVVLPALPDAWKAGSVSGLCGPNGYVAEIEFAGGRLTRLGLTGRFANREPVCVRYGAAWTVLNLAAGERVWLDGNLEPVHADCIHP